MHYLNIFKPQKIKLYINNMLQHFVTWTLNPYLSDKTYLELRSKLKVGYKFNLDNPQTFNEKLSWLKIHDRKDIYTTMVDKYRVKEYVAKKIGSEYVTPLIGVWDDINHVEFESLPIPCMLKSNVGSGKNMLYTGDKEKAIALFAPEKKKLDHYWLSREWPHKNIEPKIIAEEALDNGGEPIIDYKFYVFNGVPKYIYVTVKEGDIFENFYDMDFNPVPINHSFPRRIPEFDRPKQFELMKELAQKLSDNLPFIRIDFMLAKDKIFFAEYTFYDWGGMLAFEDDWDAKLGELINIDHLK
jgi:hypothetical protein